MAAGKNRVFAVRFTGLRPLMFDRYAGDNATKLAPEDRMYLSDQRVLTIPAINLFSMLAAENTKSVCRQFFGKQGKTIALGISSYTNIAPFEIQIENDSGPVVFNGFDKSIFIHKAVGRLKNGIPNPKERPTLALPWMINFTVEYQENRYCTLDALRSALDMGGTIGLGTFRPYFGRYAMTKFDEVM